MSKNCSRFKLLISLKCLLERTSSLITHFLNNINFFPPLISIMSTQCYACQTFTENGNNCCVCHLWNCKDCIIFKEEYHSNTSYYFCDMCNRNQNPESRATCWVCETIDNIEEGADCHKCHHWTCSECVLFGDDGNYFCQECAK